MGLKELYRKAKIHISHVVLYKSPTFTFFRILVILSRYIPLPRVIFTYTVTGYQGEKHLEKFMCPSNNGCFVDVGANVGYWTMFVARKGFDVHAFEPSPRPYRILKHRTKRYSKVKSYPIALGEKTGLANMKLMKSFSKNSVMGVISDNPPGEEGDIICEIQVPIRTLDSYEIDDVAVIKIDTEGYEIPILKGAEKTILRCKPRLIIEVHYPPFKEESKRIIKILERWGYNWTMINKLTISGIIPQPHIIGTPR